MSKTFGQLFSKVSRQTGQPYLTFSDGKGETHSIKEDISDIQKEVLTISGTYLTKSWVAIVGGTVASQKSYDIPATVDKITSVRVTVDSNEYFPNLIGIPEFNSYANTNQVSDIPIFYVVDKGQVVLFPTPETSSNAIELNANIYATDLVIDPSVTTDSTTELEIKEGFENVIYYYALMEAFTRLEDFASADRYSVKFEKLFKGYEKKVHNTTNSVVVKRG